MRELTEPELPGLPSATEPSRRLADGLRETAIVLGCFAALALIGALVWWQVVSLPHYLVGPEGGAMDEEQLSKQVAIDGWYAVIAVVGGVVAGTLIALRFQRDLVLTVVLLVLGGALAAWVMRTVGLAVGPPDPKTVLEGAKQGSTVPVQLAVTMPAVYLIWPVAALLGSVGVVWGTDSKKDDAEPDMSAWEGWTGPIGPAEPSGPTEP